MNGSLRFVAISLLCLSNTLTHAAIAKPTNNPKGAASANAEDPKFADEPQAPEVRGAQEEGPGLSTLSPRDRAIAEVTRSLKWQDGPAKISLACGVTVNLTEDHRYLDAPQSARLLEAYGHSDNERSQGIIGPKDADADWQAYLDYEASGYVKDDEKVDAADLLKALREGQEEDNKKRKEGGHPALAVLGWATAPHYNQDLHHLVWALNVRAEGQDENAVNYNTRILGRRGFLALNFVSGASTFEAYKPVADQLLSAVSFNAGARYADFTPKTDKIAEYGLTGLILAGAGLGAAKLAGKVGLLALFAKGGKGLFLLLLAPLAALRRWWNRRSGSEPTDPTASP